MLMFVYRVAKTEERAADLSGMGAFLAGGRWNSPGTFMLYTSANSSLAYLEMLAHFEELYRPPKLYITKIKLDDDMIHFPDDGDYPKNWQAPGNLQAQAMGDGWMLKRKYLAVAVKSAINPTEYNYLLNPSFPGFNQLATIESIVPLGVDVRLLK